MDDIIFIEGDVRCIEKVAHQEMEKPLKHYEKELLSIRTGRASTALIEHLMVESYGQMMPLRDLATLSAPEARLLTVQPWDTGIISAIEKAITTSDLGLTPLNDGKLIRMQLPQMSADRREELIKNLGKKTEEARIGIRNVRRDMYNIIREAQKDHTVSEDFAHRLSEHLQKITDAFIAKAEALQKKKIDELQTI